MRQSKFPTAAPALICLLAAAAWADSPAADRFSVHYQATVIDQGDARFTAPYSGPNSLRPDPESATSATSTLFLGARLRPGTEVYANPELTAGSGLSGSRGVAGFPNGETFRIGESAPTVYAARLYLKQMFGLGGETEALAEGPNQVADAVAARRLTVVAGKFGLADYFDGNAYAHDPRSQFMNWTLMAAGAWDYPADTRGYTWGLMLEYREPEWAVRGAAVAEPKQANMLDFDRRIGRADGSVIEGEHELRLIDGRRGTARLLVYLNQARMGNYDQALARPGVPDVTATREYGRTKYGASFNADHELTESLGGFTRASWSDGRNETWTFTEVDASQSLGVEWTPARWNRPQDRWGTAAVVNELSSSHRRYLANGGSGFLLGDGALHYGPEMIAETYYRCEVREHLFVSPDYQLLVDPGYNRSRGPVSVWALRVHAEF
ncbi:MAG TPA: carbohydrate porin [Elusimicrobiota bacterium]|nr:carbohydrate porin [Elusimicrobiota bacterium]